jgi:hypothetical protein
VRPASIFALAALIPTATNASAWALPPTPTILLCSAEIIAGAGRLPSAPNNDEHQRCPKGCHSGSSRKRYCTA